MSGWRTKQSQIIIKRNTMEELNKQIESLKKRNLIQVGEITEEVNHYSDWKYKSESYKSLNIRGAQHGTQKKFVVVMKFVN